LRQSSSELGTFWHRSRSAFVGDVIDRVGAREVVDVGAGAGHLGRWLRRHRPEVRYRFQEPLPSLSDALERSFGAASLVQPDDDLHFADLVTLLDVLEHVEDDVAMLTTLVDRMRPGATVLLTVPAVPWLYSWWDESLGHHRRYSRPELRKAATDAGIQVLECAYLFPELVPPAVARRRRRPNDPTSEPAEFPDLPDFVDSTLFRITRTSSRLRRMWPIGTSLVLVGRT
jgi:hypothetical protein